MPRSSMIFTAILALSPFSKGSETVPLNVSIFSSSISERDLLLVDIFLYLFNAALKFRLAGHSLFIISVTCAYVVSEKQSTVDPHPLLNSAAMKRGEAHN